MAPKELITALLEKIEQIEKRPSAFYNGDFLQTWDHTEEELKNVIDTADCLQQMFRGGISARLFDGPLAVSHFRDQSTRTRFSFQSAASLLGMSHSELEESKSQIAHGETVRETANMISFLAEAVGIRHDMYLGEGHSYMLEVSEALQEGFNEGVLPKRPAVINLQSDYDHPTQSLSDLLHLKNTFGSLDALKGKKIAVTWAYSPSYGKPLSVPQGLIGLLPRFGMDVVLAHPEGYDLLPDIVQHGKEFAKQSGGSFTQVSSMEEAFVDADIVYPKSWAPYQIMERRTELLRSRQHDALTKLEEEALANNAKHTDWECDADKMAKTRDGNALYMHCLPADISDVSCKKGEVSAEVFEKYRLATYHEAGYKPFIIAAMIVLCRFPQPTDVLRKLLEHPSPNRTLW